VSGYTLHLQILKRKLQFLKNIKIIMERGKKEMSILPHYGLATDKEIYNIEQDSAIGMFKIGPKI